MTTFVDLGRDINELKPSIIALRRELHQHPELAFEEVWTAATLAAGARGKEERMTEAGILSIMRRGHTYQVRYASSNPYDMDRPPYLCPDEGAMITLLHHYGIDAWSLQQAIAVLRKGAWQSCLWCYLRRRGKHTSPLANESKVCLPLVRGADAPGL